MKTERVVTVEQGITAAAISTERKKADYLKSGGRYCPSCRGEDITAAGGFEADLGYVTQDAECQTCGATWTDVYTLAGVDKFEEGRGTDEETI